MSDNKILTANEQNAIRTAVAAQTSALLEQVQATTIEAITTNQNRIVDTIQKRILETLNANQKVVITTAQHGNSGAKETTRWQFIMSLAPVVLTALLGMVIWKSQTDVQQNIWETQASIQQRIDQDNARLATRLTFTDEFYKRRFAAYEKFYGQVIRLRSLLESETLRSQSEAIDVLAKLDRDTHHSTDKLFLSDKIVGQMDTLWIRGIDVLRYQGQGNLSAYQRQVEDLEKRMKEDLWTEPLD